MLWPPWTDILLTLTLLHLMPLLRSVGPLGVSWPTEIWCIYHSRKNVGRVFFLQISQCGQTPDKSAADLESCHITETRRHTGCWWDLLIEGKNPFLSLVGNRGLDVCLTSCLRRESSGGGGGPDFCEINFF